MFKKTLFLFIFCFSNIAFGLPSHFVQMISSHNGPYPFRFKVNNGSWQTVGAGRTVGKFYNQITGATVQFGSGTVNAITPNCHKFIPFGLKDTAYDGKNHYVVYSGAPLELITEQLGVNARGNRNFILIDEGSNRCNGSASDCEVFDCMVY